MIRNYYKIAFRNLWKHKAFSLINILGLAVGMSACLLIFLYVSFELSYDSFNKKSDRIYRLVTDVKTPSETINLDVTSWSFAPNIKKDYPEVEAFTRFFRASFLITQGSLHFQEEKTMFADSSLFSIFDFKLVKGNPATALKNPLNIVLSERAAKKYFGDKDPIGKTLLFSNESLAATVTGIMQNIPENSQIKGDVFVSMSTLTTTLNKNLDDQWGNFGAVSYLLLRPGANPSALEKKLPAFLQIHIGKMMKETNVLYILVMEPLKQVYLKSLRGGWEHGSATNVYIFSAVGLFILLIACINFINLTTARSSERAKEVGIRKVVGAGKTLLARQFVTESIIICLIASLLSLLLSAAVIPLFNDLSGKQISNGIISNIPIIAGLLLLAVSTGIVAGIYPALVLTSFQPAAVLKGRFTTSQKGALLRKVLVTFQFVISTLLITITFVVYTQMNFMRDRDLGFSKEQMLIIDSKGDPKLEAFRQLLAEMPGVQSTAASVSIPGGPFDGAYSEIENKNGDFQVAHLGLYQVNFEFIDQFKLKIIAGRPFSKEFATDSTNAMVVNEAAVKLLGYSSPSQAIGRKFKQWGYQGTIIGVIKDFHFASLHEVIKPLTMRINEKSSTLLAVKIHSGNIKSTLAAIQNQWTATLPGRPFSYYFMDEFFDRQYRSEERFEKIFFNFTVLAVFIACLGLLGLATYNTVQRTKEIGIRKIMGASIQSIVGLLSGDFLKLVMLSVIIASPLAYFGINKWLESFAYRTEIKWWIFALPAVLSISIAFATVVFQSIKAALLNPIKSLKND